MSIRNSTPIPTIATVLLPTERSRVEAAGNGSFSVLHRETVPEAIRAVRERAVDAVLLSVHRCDAVEAAAVRQLVRAFPGLPAVALVTRHDDATPASILRLGASGIKEVVDVTAPAGWGRLRHVVAEPATRPAARILGPLLERLPGIPEDGRIFLEALVRLAPHTPTVRGLTRVFGVQPSTLMSRFGRAGLPSAKRYLASIRLLYAAQYMESEGMSIADVAYRLECSSPQSFGRHVRSLLGITCTEFRRRFPFPVALERFLAVMIEPYQARWRDFHPLISTGGRPGIVPDPAISDRDQ
ncbi:MAG: Helix-turn-helix, AraC protein [Gemmatimonadetes bacterium]|nr:Helix-turn-helix, AraC protein [Gemmatimonadota bacterium]